MSYETLLYDLSDGIAEIRLNRPQRLNAVTRQLYDELNDALGRAEAAPEARVVLIPARAAPSASAPTSRSTRPGAPPSTAASTSRASRTCAAA